MFSHLDIPTKYQYLTGTLILVSMGRFFDTMIDVDYSYHANTYTYTRATLVDNLSLSGGINVNLICIVDFHMQLTG